MTPQSGGNEIAVIGMAGRFPGAADTEAFWRNLCQGVESIRFLTPDELTALGADPATLQDPRHVPAVAELSGMESFDAAFFGINHREAELMDPQQRVFLQTAWQALESAGYDPEAYQGAIGVFGGATTSTYMLFNLATNPDVVGSVDRLQLLVGNALDSLTTRIAYKLNLRGPSFTIQCACSTSLIAVHVACQSLIAGECDMALAGGVSINVSQRTGYSFTEGSILSPDGHCRAFADDARGTVFGSGIGIVVLKRLEDALTNGDHIHAVIKGSAINNDGSLKVGYTAPSVDGQARVITEAIAASGVDADRISYIEAHGTGTNLGDPIEIQALTKAFRAFTQKQQFCAIGSVKANIGHLDVAAGVAGLIKTVLALERGLIPPSLHCAQPNSKIDFQQSPVYVNTALTEWKSPNGPRLAGVSAFGFGGTNAHVIIEEAPPAAVQPGRRSHELLTLSAKTPHSLTAAACRLAGYLEQSPDVHLPDVAYTLHVGRRAFSHRRAIVCSDAADAVAELLMQDGQEDSETGPTCVPDRPVVFMFSGQGTQHVGMGREIYTTEPLFREKVDRCAELLEPWMGVDLRSILYPSHAERELAVQRLDQTGITQPALFALEYALAALWMDWGVRPHSMIGHSIGEYVAACLAGVLTLEDALRLVALRGKLVQSMPSGRMLAVPIPEDSIRSFLTADLSVAAVNEPARCVVSGPHEAVMDLEKRLSHSGVLSQRLRTSHAFHSGMLDPIVGCLVQELRKIRLQPPRIPYISNVTGRWIEAREATDPEYWGLHLRQTVRFADGIAELSKTAQSLFLEVGPGRSLAVSAKHCAGGHEAVQSMRHPREAGSDVVVLLRALSRLWCAGAPVDWGRFHSGEQRRRVPLPTYAFDERRYWVEPGRASVGSSEARPAQAAGAPVDGDASATAPHAAESRDPRPSVRSRQTFHPRPRVSTAFVAPAGDLERDIAAIWREALGLNEVGVEDNFFELGGDSLLATQLVSRLSRAFEVQLPLDQLFESPTVARVAELVILAKIAQTDGDAVTQILAETAGVAASSGAPSPGSARVSHGTDR